jgi:hypothetical protein
MFAQCHDFTIHVSLFTAAGGATHQNALTRLRVCLYSLEIWDHETSFPKTNKKIKDSSCLQNEIA